MHRQSPVALIWTRAGSWEREAMAQVRWALDSWIGKPVEQSPFHDASAPLADLERQLADYPPLVFAVYHDSALDWSTVTAHLIGNVHFPLNMHCHRNPSIMFTDEYPAVKMSCSNCAKECELARKLFRALGIDCASTALSKL